MNGSERVRVDPLATAFLDDLDTLSSIGATPGGGVHREAASPADGETRRWFCSWLSAHGFTTVVDEIGNIFGLIELVPGAPFILAGSHLDSQPTAGRLDGAYGVVAAAHAALTVCRAVSEQSLTPRFNLAVVDWFNEEGSRFTPSVMGSGVFAGKLNKEQSLRAKDSDGISVAEALEGIGFLGTQRPPEVAAYSEIHIEQGRTLEDSRNSIGIVEANWAVAKFDLTVIGAQSHTGATLLDDRCDALLAAATLVVAVREIAARATPGKLLASVGRLSVYPNSPVVVPSRVKMAIDIRSGDETLLAEAVDALTHKFDEIEKAEGVEIGRQDTTARPAVAFPESGIQLAEAVAKSLGLPYRKMATRAGHDSIHMNSIVPTIMSFVPSKNGISHNEAEDTDDVDLVNGVYYFSEVLKRLVSGALQTAKDNS